MARCFALCIWALLFSSALATPPNQGWRIELASHSAHLSDIYERSHSIPEDRPRRLQVQVPINFYRYAPLTSSVILVTLWTSPYVVENITRTTNGTAQTSVSTMSVDVPEEPQFSAEAFFEMDEPEQDVLLSIGFEDIYVSDTEPASVEAYGIVLARDPETGWIARAVPEYDHLVNVAITQEVEARLPEGVQIPIPNPADLGILPDPNSNDGPDPSGKDGNKDPATTPTTPTTTSPGTQPPTTISTTCDGASTTGPGGDCTCARPPETIYITVTANPADQCQCERSTVTRYQTVTAKGPRPASSSQASHHREVRQALKPTTFINAKFSFTDRNYSPAPIRRLVILATGGYYRGSVRVRDAHDIGITDGNGQLTFDFLPNPGETVKLDKIFTYCATGWYRVGTVSVNNDFQMKVINMDIDPEVWSVAEGQTINAEALYQYSVYNLGLLVADAYTTITEWFAQNVATQQGEQERIDVVFPGEADKAFFQENAEGPRIVLGEVHAFNPSVMAHEFGHFAHFIARSKKAFGGGGPHSLCQDKLGVNKGLDLAFGEGYATALGQSAIDDTPLIDSWAKYGQYTNRQYYPLTTWSVNVEDYDCPDRYLNAQEGRIAAAMFDLVDRKLDVFPASSNDLGRVEVGFEPYMLNWRWKPRFIFWNLMQENPRSIEEYWLKFKSYPGITRDSEEKAWAILTYNYADFDRF
ncbi:hypothetical protein B0T10DRAFT_563527 [Thelonectria olida]|uniref:Uncharacterized protein n=1 Tax=Thelonectria olida TaxID=1576542 RepID=A0A9P8W3J7_9HYPO|nr:hypothetical protein B0T10DRAFT_563527 [Thelonectria olida]